LDRKSLQFIDRNKGGKTHAPRIAFTQENEQENKRPKQTARKPKKTSDIFGSVLYLKSSDASDLYRDIVDLYNYYVSNKTTLSSLFPGLIRMALRLLVETAANDENLTMDKYLTKHFSKAKQNFDQDIKTTLSTQNVTESSIIQLLHVGAHKYHSASNLSQTIAISIVIGEILKITHGKEN
jgi:hypothetical protein